MPNKFSISKVKINQIPVSLESFFSFRAILLFSGLHRLFALSVHSLELIFIKLCVDFPPSPKSFSIVFLWTTTCPFPPLMILFLVTCSFCEHWPIQCLNFSVAPSLTFLHSVDFMVSNFHLLFLPLFVKLLVFSLSLYFSILVFPTLPVHNHYLSFCHFWQNQTLL